jgi:hypothetical protein
MSGWRIECPHCATGSLLPEGIARAGSRVRCPSCAAAYVVAAPDDVEERVVAVRAWAEARPGGLEGVRDDRAEGHFWSEHGESFLAQQGIDDAPEAWAAALARVLGPGPTLF